MARLVGPTYHAVVHVKRHARLSGIHSGCGIALLWTNAAGYCKAEEEGLIFCLPNSRCGAAGFSEGAA